MYKKNGVKGFLRIITVYCMVPSVTCLFCPYGQYANNTRCNPCTVGYWCPGGQSDPIVCEASDWCAVIFQSQGISMRQINPSIVCTYDAPVGTCAILPDQTACQTAECVTYNYYQHGFFSAYGIDKQYHGGNLFLPCAQCVAGTYISSECSGDGNTMCSACEDGYYCPGDGVRYECKTCPTNRKRACTPIQNALCIPDGYFLNGLEIKQCRSVCEPGNNEIKPCNETDRVCQSCDAGFYCFNGIKHSCPPKTTSSINATGYNDCYCSPGSYGKVISPDQAECTQCATGSFCPATVVKTLCDCILI